MNYMLLGCFLLSLVDLSVPAIFQVQQKPRFYGVNAGRQVGITCSASDLNLQAVVTWYKIEKYEEDKVPNDHMHQFKISRSRTESGKMNGNGHLFIKDVEVKDSGIYYCKMNQTWGRGTELQVFRQSKPEVVKRRNCMKDVIIFLQGFLLMLFIIIPLVWYYRLEQQEEAVYEEPEHDHTYEGLEIEHCGDLYEDLTQFAQNPAAEANWQVESPEQEC